MKRPTVAERKRSGSEDDRTKRRIRQVNRAAGVVRVRRCRGCYGAGRRVRSELRDAAWAGGVRVLPCILATFVIGAAAWRNDSEISVKESIVFPFVKTGRTRSAGGIEIYRWATLGRNLDGSPSRNFEGT
jgi:hypothetical protein